ncbi:C40 family peptidase [Nocardia paucivorans]|uniref:C40 family peptidase n=1 Tax=Nocardia paucivorans TaxID=114259 RepID=UPI000686CBCA|nr:NlpC/P60 family protein [Nocardia paucivorans]
MAAPSIAGAPAISGEPSQTGMPDVRTSGPLPTKAPEPLVDPDMVADLVPAASSAGTSMLPLLGTALAGLLGGGGGQQAEPQSTAATPGTQPATGVGLAPDEQQALEALNRMADVYGDGEPKNPQAKKLREELGETKGSGRTATAVKAQRLFQANAASAFNNLDNQLAAYTTGLAGSNKIDKKAVVSLIREVNVELAELGPYAYTKQGHQKVRQILSTALRKAHRIVSGGQAKSTDTAAAINRLANQYLYNLAGQQAPGGQTVAGGSTAAQQLLRTALAQIGKPYIWGAEGPGGFDCSGLVQYAARSAGRNVPRVAAAQYQALPKIHPQNIQPGDLIFPSSSFKGAGAPGHVMIYIGNGQCVHAPRPGRTVTTTSLPSSFQAARAV